MTQILTKARKLRTSEQFKKVFPGPDRSTVEREIHRELIKQLKVKRNNEPGKRFYIKGQI